MTEDKRPRDGTSEEQKNESALFPRLKPYLERCLALNHDLNNPLTGVMNYCEFLLEDADQLSDEHREFVDQITSCAEQMKRVLDELCEEKMVLERKVDIQELLAADPAKRRPSDELIDLPEQPLNRDRDQEQCQKPEFTP